MQSDLGVLLGSDSLELEKGLVDFVARRLGFGELAGDESDDFVNETEDSA
jgi:hypothetical protein